MSYLGLLLTSFSYLALLFGIAYRADLYKARGRSWINNANVYSLSLAVYCTAWTFYGSVGLAAKGGVMFLPIYLGPTLLALLWSGVLRKMIRIAKRYAITSLADFLSVRYGNSTFLGGLVTVIAFVGIIPYISLQIKAIGFGFDLIAQSSGNSADTSSDSTTFFITLALVAFTILFGVRHLDATERHEGMVAAIAFESIVKLLAFVVCGVVVVYGGFGGLGALFKEAVQKPELAQSWSFTSPGVYEDWFFLNLLAMLAILLLPRQFQVAVVENVNEDHVNRASWLFPLYLLVINLFVLPLALAGRLLFPEGNVDADTFVLTLPLLLGNDLLAWFVFIGGFSAATGMIVVETVALSNMLCNSLIMPILIRLPFVNLKEGRGLNSVLLFIRRGSVALVLLASYAYYQLVGSAYSLVSIGLISFLAVAQFAPSIIGGLYWSQGNRNGALMGLGLGFGIWLYTLLFTQAIQAGLFDMSWLTQGPGGLEWLKPTALFGYSGTQPIVQATFWSLTLNLLGYLLGSLLTNPTQLERQQAKLFVDALKLSELNNPFRTWKATATPLQLKRLLERILGPEHTRQALVRYTEMRGKSMPQFLDEELASGDLIQYTEKMLSGSIGSVSARIMVSSVVQEEPIGMEEVMNLLDATQQAIAYGQQLETKSRELEQVTEDLKNANARLQELDGVKDEFISTITHELRTPLTSIRAFSEILHDTPDLPPEKQREFLKIVIKESERLTRLIGQILDFEKLESGKMQWNLEILDVHDIIKDALASIGQLLRDGNISVEARIPEQPLTVEGDRDRLLQVLLNLLSNAAKFCPTQAGRIELSVSAHAEHFEVRVRDNGIGIPEQEREKVFEKFRQLESPQDGKPQGTGLGLSISKTIVEHHGGQIGVAPGSEHGAIFFFTLPIYTEVPTPPFSEEKHDAKDPHR